MWSRRGDGWQRVAKATLGLVREVGEALIGKVLRRSALEQDALIYLASSAFAFLTSAFATDSDYRTWGWIATMGYLAAAILAELIQLRASRSDARGATGDHRSLSVRVGLVVFVIVSAVLLPLAIEMAWRAQGTPGSHGQAEVVVIERAGDRVAAGTSPYLPQPTEIGGSATSYNRHLDAGSYFPYLPGMAAFGLLNPLAIPVAFTDARFVIVLFTLAVTALALRLSRASPNRRVRVAQFVLALPVGALPLSTGGDDLPVIALLLLGLVLAARRSPVAAGAIFGLAATLKFTAWPILLLMALAARDDRGRHVPLRYFSAAMAVLLPVTVLGFIPSPRAFITSVIRFPLGLTTLRSPAASPLLGQILTTILPAERRPITIALLIVGFLIVAIVVKVKVPKTTAEVAGFAAFALLVATVLAPATRFGYLIYPIDLAVFAYLVVDPPTTVAAGAQSWSFSSRSWSSTWEDASIDAPPSAAENDEAAEGSTSSSTSQ